MKRFATEMVTAAPIKTKFATPLFCEDPIFSIPTEGKRYHAIKVDHAGSIPMLNIAELRMIIDTCAAFMDVANAQGEGPAFRKALQNITSRLESTYLQDIVRTALSNY